MPLKLQNQRMVCRALADAGGRLQSVGKYFPYGEDRYNPNPANPANDQEKFATYTRDSATGLDYAYQRYYAASMGRFWSADPYGPSAKRKAPQSWNRYAYAESDPTNLIDPSGAILMAPGPGGGCTVNGLDFTDYFAHRRGCRVLVNRTKAKGYPSTIGAVASQPNQFLGFTAAMAKLTQAEVSLRGSSLCNDLTYAVDALEEVLDRGSQLSTTYLFWKAINQGAAGLHRYQPGCHCICGRP